MVMDLGSTYQAAANRANYQNDRRYKQALKETKKLRRRNMRDVRQFGRTSKMDLETSARNRQAQVRQELTSRGLAHSTVLPTMLGGIDKERARHMIALNESIAGQRMQARTAGTDRVVDIIRSRNDNAPDPGMLAQLSQGLGAGGMGMGGMDGGMGGGIDPRTIMQQQLMQQAWQQQMMRQQQQQQQQQVPQPNQLVPNQALSRFRQAMLNRRNAVRNRNFSMTQRSTAARQAARLPRTSVNLNLWK